MERLSALLMMYLLVVVNPRNIAYYPFYHDPEAIVFEGPTNYNETHERNYQEDSDNVSTIYDIDVRFGQPDDCPAGYEKVGDLCFPND
ncbi:unnamed protein product [Pieris macdunnoughi]|uniref:Uncharacterized protein n=1 Tax=Pieris macdunnoughi TaxID=345717 RepID=A0A821S4U1_9NEOP|nr:unnamed protein product [Pieris macdunnoughi]